MNPLADVFPTLTDLVGDTSIIDVGIIGVTSRNITSESLDIVGRSLVAGQPISGSGRCARSFATSASTPSMTSVSSVKSSTHTTG